MIKKYTNLILISTLFCQAKASENNSTKEFSPTNILFATMGIKDRQIEKLILDYAGSISWGLFRVINQPNLAKSIALSNDGYLVSSNGNLLNIVDIDTSSPTFGQNKKTIHFNGKDDSIRTMITSPCEKYVAYGTDSLDNNLKIIKIEENCKTQDLVTIARQSKNGIGHSKYVSSLAFSPDSLIMASASSFRLDNIQIFDMEEKLIIHEFINKDRESIRCLDFLPKVSEYNGWSSPDDLVNEDYEVYNACDNYKNYWIASGSFEGTINIHNFNKRTNIVDSINIKCKPNAHNGLIYSLKFSPCFKYLASASFDRTIKIWYIHDYSEENQLILKLTLNGHDDAVMSIAFSPCGKYLASASDDQTIKIWSFDFESETNGQCLQTIEVENYIDSIIFSKSGKYLYCASRDKQIKVYRNLNNFLETTLFN